MCALIGPIMYAGRYVSFIIRPAGKTPIAGEGDQGVFDARRFFAEDRNFITKEEIASLHAAADSISEKAKGLGYDYQHPMTLYIQCKEGKSRSARCLGAFLMKFYRYDKDKVLSILRDGYQNQTDGCDQKLNENSVDNWLTSFANYL